MVMPAVDLTGKRFGYLTATHRGPPSSTGRATWVCRCDCGSEVTRESQSLRSKHRPNLKHCGCRHGEHIVTHGMSRSRPYGIWTNMKRRCTDADDKDWHKYGGRGIEVCDRWLESFDNFWADMEHGYAPNLTLGRIQNNGPYSPGNCRWETPAQQGVNRRTNRLLNTPKGLLTLSEAAKAYGLLEITLAARLDRYGWPLDRALSTPTKKPSTS